MKQFVEIRPVSFILMLLAVFCYIHEAGGIEYCSITHDYTNLGKVCYVDSKNGNDANNGLSSTSAVKSQNAIPQSSVVICYKRGSVFNEALVLKNSAKVYTNYGDPSSPLPRFVVPTEPMSGPVILSMMKTGLTFDGLFLAGARGNGTMDSLIGGIGVMLGPNSKILNCEITSCDIGVMMSGEGSLMQGCYIHDLIMGVDDAPGIDPNLVGGAEGIFVNASNCEVAYNSFVNCTGPAKWVGDNGGCDGGAVEITATSGKVLSGVKFHHNFALNCCGFFEVNTTFGGKGTVSNTEFYSNLIIDCGWMGLLQVNNTWLKNIHYTNNTLIQHKGSVNSGIFFIIYTDTSSGLAGGQLDPNTVFLTNNLFVLDSVTTYNTLFDSNFVQSGNLVVKTKEKNPGFVNLKGTNSSDFTLTEASPAHGTGTAVTQNILDFFNRPMKNPSTPDIGAFQIGTSQTDCIPRLPFFDNAEITISKKIQSSSKAIYTNSEINVSLNPLTSILTITNRTNLNSSTQLKVYNIQGKRLYETLFEGNKPISRMDMSPFKPGIYFVKIQSGSQEYMQQIAKR